jgi:hypothetical protein
MDLSSGAPLWLLDGAGQKQKMGEIGYMIYNTPWILPNIYCDVQWYIGPSDTVRHPKSSTFLDSADLW